MNTLAALERFDIDEIFRRLISVGATSVPFLNANLRASLLREAVGYSYKREAEIVGSGERTVRQQVGSFEDFTDSSEFIRLRTSFEGLVSSALATLAGYPFATPFRVDSMILNKYEAGSLGITPHRDRARYINLIGIVVIGGSGQFQICQDRSGSDATEIAAPPGHAILMRAPGFPGAGDRPFHCVSHIRESRYTLVLRQRRPSSVTAP
ncbi:MAG: hypothetical protein OES46_05255 [Gammaproteobacteria bacterium]|nr:hypothetical protein [Gammaproteobacteria bacterium]